MGKSHLNLTVDSEITEIAKSRKMNLSEFLENSLSSYLGATGEDSVIVERQILELEEQKEKIDLQIKLLKTYLDTLKTREEFDRFRDEIFVNQKPYLIKMYETKSLNWNKIAEVFKFNSVKECKTYIHKKLEADGLILNI